MTTCDWLPGICSLVSCDWLANPRGGRATLGAGGFDQQRPSRIPTKSCITQRSLTAAFVRSDGSGRGEGGQQPGEGRATWTVGCRGEERSRGRGGEDEAEGGGDGGGGGATAPGEDGRAAEGCSSPRAHNVDADVHQSAGLGFRLEFRLGFKFA
eukprot:4310190-Pyramimonas_sp.AAC.1